MSNCCDRVVPVKTNALPVIVTDKTKLFVTQLEQGVLVTAVSNCGKQTNGMVLNDYGLAKENGFVGTLEDWLNRTEGKKYYTTVEPGNYNEDESNVYLTLEDCIAQKNPVKDTEMANDIINNNINVKLCVVNMDKVEEELFPTYSKYGTDIITTFMKPIFTTTNISVALYNFGKFDLV